MSKLSPSIIEAVKKRVTADFPELVGVEPSCKLKKVETAIAKQLDVSLPKKVGRVYVLTFRKQIEAESLQLARVVRATVTARGKLLKVTVSK
jgi:hypothetical protein